MFRTIIWPALAFLSGVGVLKAAIPLESMVLMVVGLGLSSFGLLRLTLRDTPAQPFWRRRATAVADPDER